MRKKALVVVIGVLFAGLAFADDKLEERPPLKAGQWVVVRVKRLLPESDAWKVVAQLSWVDRVKGTQASVKHQPLADDGKEATGASQEATLDVQRKSIVPTRGKVVKTSDEVLEIGGKKVKCQRKETLIEGDTLKGKKSITLITWTSPEIPSLAECVRKVHLEGGKEMFRYELLDFGEKGGAERPVKKGPGSDKK